MAFCKNVRETTISSEGDASKRGFKECVHVSLHSRFQQKTLLQGYSLDPSSASSDEFRSLDLSIQIRFRTFRISINTSTTHHHLHVLYTIFPQSDAMVYFTVDYCTASVQRQSLFLETLQVLASCLCMDLPVCSCKTTSLLALRS